MPDLTPEPPKDKPVSINAMSFDESSIGDTEFIAETKLPTDRGFYRLRGVPTRGGRRRPVRARRHLLRRHRGP